MKHFKIGWLPVLLLLAGLTLTGCGNGQTKEQLQEALEAERTRTASLTASLEAEAEKQATLQDSLDYHARNNDIFRKQVQSTIEDRDSILQYNSDMEKLNSQLQQTIEDTSLQRQQLPSLLPSINLHNVSPSVLDGYSHQRIDTTETDDLKEAIDKEKSLLAVMNQLLDVMEKMEALHHAEEENYRRLHGMLSDQYNALRESGQEDTVACYNLEIKMFAAWDALVQMGTNGRHYASQNEQLKAHIDAMEKNISVYEGILSVKNSGDRDKIQTVYHIEESISFLQNKCDQIESQMAQTRQTINHLQAADTAENSTSIAELQSYLSLQMTTHEELLQEIDDMQEMLSSYVS